MQCIDTNVNTSKELDHQESEPLDDFEFHALKSQLTNDVSKKKPVFESNVSDIDEMIKLVPSVITNLDKEGMSSAVLDFFRLVDNAFPLKNIALLLWLEVVK